MLNSVVRLLPALIVAALAGCSATKPSTHYWEGAKAQSSGDYRRDNAQCADTAPEEPMLEDSLSFQAYRDCMTSKGYVLRTY